jgi:autoinducer 2 (AI-2) kinase
MDQTLLRENLVDILRELFAAGLITPTGGNLSVRLPDNEGILITPTSSYKGGLTPDEIVHVDLQGHAVNPEQQPSVETQLHIQVYALRKKIGGVIHAHSPLATILGVCNIPIPPVTVDATPFVGIPIMPFAMSGMPDEIENLTRCLGNAPAVLLQNHGVLTVGRSLRQAADRALELEQVARTVLVIRGLGIEPVLMPDREAALLKKVLGG